jgi:integrase/recombinase XerD
MSKYDPHNYKRREELALISLKKSDIPKKNKQFVIDFRKDCIANGLTSARISKYLYRLKKVSELLNHKQFDKVTKEDIKEAVVKIEQSDYAELTKVDTKVIIKRFYAWIRNCEYREYPPEVRWIRGHHKMHNKVPDELLTEEEVRKLINVASSLRDKALVAILYESGCRIAELLGLRFKNVTFDEYGAVLIVDGKTGVRRIRIVTSVGYLIKWINNYPFEKNPENPVWTTFSKVKIMNYALARRILLKMVKKAGIKKRVHPHLFRHSRATHLASHLKEAQMKEYFGWTQSSRMASTYIHLSGRDVDLSILRVNGIQVNEEDKKPEFMHKKCPKCEENNLPTNSICFKCGVPLDNNFENKELIEKKEANTIIDKLLQDKDFRKLLAQKIMTSEL